MNVGADGREKVDVGANADTVERDAAVRRWKKRIVIFSFFQV